MIKTKCSILIIFVSLCCLALGQSDDHKSSLTFVIDETRSMTDDIAEVKNGANRIFDVVLNSNASQIENFILVTFNDPNVKPALITKDKDTFRNAINSITLIGNPDCPEMAFKGIEEGLIKSLPGSYIYVFTDASAKDYAEFPRIKSIAQKKQSQIVFVLTGICAKESDPDYQVYHKMAEATSGQVFNLKKSEVGKILKYVEETVKGPRTIITAVKFPPGYNNTLNYTVDGKINDVIISVSGSNPNVNVSKPDGSAAKIHDIVKTERINIVKVSDIKPGVNTATVGSESETVAIVTGDTRVNFKVGFSVFKPSAMNDTTTKPIPDQKSYIAIELLNKQNDVELQTIEILNMDNNIIAERPLQKVEGNFYVTDPTDLPKDMFKIAIKGHITSTKEPIRRVSLIPIEAQKLFHDKIVNKAPKVTIEGEPIRTVSYGNALQLKCKVNGYPMPTITWIDEKTKSTLLSTSSQVDIPYDYISILTLDQVKENTTYKCRAFNDYGEDKKSVVVVADGQIIVLNVSNDTTIKYDEAGNLYCVIESSPPSHITWYFNGLEMKEEDNIEISSNGSVLTIYNMEPKLQGRYTCEAKNKFNRKQFNINVSISGAALPKIDKSIKEIKAEVKQNVDLNCRVIQGIPQPWVRWFYKERSGKVFKAFDEPSDILHLKGVNTSNAGTYRCEVENILGKDVFEIDFIVEYPPVIKFGKKLLKVQEGQKVLLPCKVEGVPAPDVKWTFNGTIIRNSSRHQINADNTLSFKASLSHEGSYSCEGVNKLGSSVETVEVNFYEPLKIKPPAQGNLKEKVGNPLTLSCEATGYPTPSIKWIFMDSKPRTLNVSGSSGALTLSSLQPKDSGFYMCIAKNNMESVNITYEVDVQAPPLILNSSDTLTAVIGDLVLRITCQATGNPKPRINWTKNGLNIASGTKWYEIQDDGTLIILNIDDNSNGTYVCSAENPLGVNARTFKVNVRESPKPDVPTKIVYVEVNKSASIDCDIPHKPMDVIRWYKDSKLLVQGELNFNNTTISDDGLYTCRVSTFTDASSETKRVIVQYKPFFLTEQNKYLDYVKGLDTSLSCEARGEPSPKVSWRQNRKILDVTEMIYSFRMSVGNIGNYTCEVSNALGTITRNFEIITKECTLNTDTTSFDRPGVTTIELRSIVSRSFNDILTVSRGEKVMLYCPSGFVDYPSREIEATCLRTSLLKIGDKETKLSEIKCIEPMRPVVKETGNSCTIGDTEMMQVGYGNSSSFSKVYEICYDKLKKQPIFSINYISPSVSSNKIKYGLTWFDNNYVPYNFDDLYDCSRQISQNLGIRSHKNDTCCFAKRQLVNSRDVPPGLPQLATYTNLNLVPHWSTCVSKNWDDVENRIRKLAKSLNRNLLVVTGTAGLLDIQISDRKENKQQIPKFLWKVVQDAMTKSSLAIIQSNVPGLTDSKPYSLCKDICGYSYNGWMRNPEWHNLSKGFTYCCSIKAFENAFGLKGQFSFAMEQIL